MSNPVVTRLLKEVGNPDLLLALSQRLSSSELNSLLLEVLKMNAAKLSPTDLLKTYEQNRFVSPSVIDQLTFLKTEIQLLELAKAHGFHAIELSPLAPLGNCSALGLVDQNKVVSALRGTEVVADATNLLALEAASRRRTAKYDNTITQLATTHRHVRAQALPPINGFTAHFKLFCAVSAGKDTGNLEFERNALVQHIQLYLSFLKELGLPDVKLIIKVFGADEQELQSAHRVADFALAEISKSFVTKQEVPLEEHRYYLGVRFSLNVVINNKEYNLGDGGVVDWSAKLTGNQKERMFTSGLGIELLIKLMTGFI